jgi:hypothetical protein
MAYSKSSPGQIAAQIAAGIAICGFCWHSLYRRAETTGPLSDDSLQQPGSTPTVQALEAVVAKTTGHYWRLKQAQDQPAKAEEGPGRP